MGFQDQLSLLMQSLTENQRLQIQYYCDSDYRHELLRYNAETQKADNVWTRRSRNERFERYWRLMTERRLRRQRLVFYLSRKSKPRPKASIRGGSFRILQSAFGQFRSEFEHTHEMLTEIFARTGRTDYSDEGRRPFPALQNILNPSLPSGSITTRLTVLIRNCPFRKIAGTAREQDRPISVSSWMDVIIPSLCCRAGRR